MHPSWSAKGWGPASCWKNHQRATYDPALCFRLLDPVLEDTLFIVWKRFQLFSKGTQQFIHLLKEEAEKISQL